MVDAGVNPFREFLRKQGTKLDAKSLLLRSHANVSRFVSLFGGRTYKYGLWRSVNGTFGNKCNSKGLAIADCDFEGFTTKNVEDGDSEDAPYFHRNSLSFGTVGDELGLRPVLGEWSEIDDFNATYDSVLEEKFCNAYLWLDKFAVGLAGSVILKDRQSKISYYGTLLGFLKTFKSVRLFGILYNCGEKAFDQYVMMKLFLTWHARFCEDRLNKGDYIAAICVSMMIALRVYYVRSGTSKIFVPLSYSEPVVAMNVDLDVYCLDGKHQIEVSFLKIRDTVFDYDCNLDQFGKRRVVPKNVGRLDCHFAQPRGLSLGTYRNGVRYEHHEVSSVICSDDYEIEDFVEEFIDVIVPRYNTYIKCSNSISYLYPPEGKQFNFNDGAFADDTSGYYDYNDYNSDVLYCEKSNIAFVKGEVIPGTIKVIDVAKLTEVVDEPIYVSETFEKEHKKSRFDDIFRNELLRRLKVVIRFKHFKENYWLVTVDVYASSEFVLRKETLSAFLYRKSKKCKYKYLEQHFIMRSSDNFSYRVVDCGENLKDSRRLLIESPFGYEITDVSLGMLFDSMIDNIKEICCIQLGNYTWTCKFKTLIK